ncbi:MAG: MBL fold metallo-hydrolase [Burkholderiales bacterium]|nr:MBL fold metallo-hydrolase [Burkholderiales bacterium]
MARPAPAPGKAFDNLSYVGSAWVSAWALNTSDGILLIDALNNEAEASTLIDGGLRQLGLDPARIKQVIVTHAHGDHYGGATYLKSRYQTRIVMSEADWKMSETQLEFAIPMWLPPPKRDVALNDGDSVVLGDTSVTLYQTPGHTMGTLTPVFELRDGARTHRAMVWGGTAFNFGKDLPRLDAYIAATQRMARLAGDRQIDVLLSNHPGYDNTVAKLAQLKTRGANDAHPFVMGVANVQRALGVMGECAQAQRDRFLLAP